MKQKITRTYNFKKYWMFVRANPNAIDKQTTHPIELSEKLSYEVKENKPFSKCQKYSCVFCVFCQ